MSIRPFPVGRAIDGANTAEFEGGFSDNDVLFPVSSNQLICCICMSYPRHQVHLPCGHTGCDFCIAKLYRENANYYDVRNHQTAKCPNCANLFTPVDVVEFDQFDPWSIFFFNSIDVNCPQGCGAVGSAQEMDQHETLFCWLRPIKCPNLECDAVQPFYMMEGWHFSHCLFFHKNCLVCGIPTNTVQDEPHDCILKLRACLDGMQ